MTTDPTSTTSASPPSEDADVPGELITAATETNTLYVLPDDVLLLPGTGLPDTKALQKLEQQLGLSDVFVIDGIDQPWILRKATPFPDDANEQGGTKP